MPYTFSTNWETPPLLEVARESTQEGDLDEILRNTQKAVEKGQRGRALNWFALGLLVNEDALIAKVRRSGLLRSSKYSFDSKLIQFLCRTILLHSDALKISAGTTQYFSSVVSLLAAASLIRSKQSDLIKSLKSERYRSLKSLLATVELLFLKEFSDAEPRVKGSPGGLPPEKRGENELESVTERRRTNAGEAVQRRADDMT
jgi:hypothetical protein